MTRRGANLGKVETAFTESSFESQQRRSSEMKSARSTNQNPKCDLPEAKRIVIVDNYNAFRLWQVAFRILVGRSGVFHFSRDHSRDSNRNGLKPDFGFVEIPARRVILCPQ